MQSPRIASMLQLHAMCKFHCLGYPLFCSTAPVDHGRVLNLSHSYSLCHSNILYLDTCMANSIITVAVEIFFQISSIFIYIYSWSSAYLKSCYFIAWNGPLNSTFYYLFSKNFLGGMPPDPPSYSMLGRYAHHNIIWIMSYKRSTLLLKEPTQTKVWLQPWCVFIDWIFSDTL